MCRLPNGEFLAVLRTGNEVDFKCQDNPIMWSVSKDEGRTWSKPARTGVEGAFPNLAVLSDGLVVMGYGRPGAMLVFSADGGRTWTDHTLVDATPYSGYTGIAEIGPGELLVGFGTKDYLDPETLVRSDGLRLARVRYRTKHARLETEELFPRIHATSFPSSSLGESKRVVVVLPEGWQQITPAKRRVLVLLHGRGRNELTLINDEETRRQLLDSGLCVILPDGDDGWYIDSPVQKSDAYETYLEEVLAVVSHAYGLPRNGKQWAIAGWSMGGFGAVNFAARYPDRFAAVISILGLLDFPRPGLPAGQSYQVPAERFGADESVWERFNPLRRAERLKGMSVLIITADDAFDRTMNEQFRDRLIELEQEPKWAKLKGGHTLQVVKEAMPHVLKHTKRVLGSDE